MNGTVRVIVPATITDVSDGPYFYAACHQCYSKLVESPDTFSCPKCRRKLSRDKVEFRYRLNMTIADFSTFATVTAFGGILNAYFGCSASDFSKRWITKLQGIAGSLEPSVTKWAIEESLVGCHLHFGFKIHPNALGIHKTEGNSGISLRDIKLQDDKSSMNPQTNSNLIAVQMITQNKSQLPLPAIFHLQCALTSFDNVQVGDNKKGSSSTEIELWKFIQKKYSRNRKIISCQNLDSSQKFYAEDGSTLSSLDQTSIALGCGDSMLISQQSQACNILGAHSKSKFVEFSDSKRDDACFVNTFSPQCIADAHCMSAGDTNEENNDIYQSSALLFESPESALSHNVKELLRDGGDGDCSLVPCSPSGNIDIPHIEGGEIANISSDLFYLSSHLSAPKNRSIASLPLCHSVNCESESLISSNGNGKNYSFKECEEHLQNLELEKLSCNKFSFGKLCLKSFSWKSKLNDGVHCKCEKSIDSVGVPAESYLHNAADSHRNSSTNHEPMTRSTHLDMPESKDLERYIEKKYSRNWQKVCGRKLTYSLKFNAENDSVSSPIELTTSQHSQACEILGAHSKNKFHEFSDSKKDCMFFVNTVSPQCIAAAQIMSEDELNEENSDNNQSSVLLSESPASAYSHHNVQELLRDGEDVDHSLVPWATNGNIDISYIKAAEIANISSDLFYLSSHLSKSKDRDNESLPLCHSVNSESESLMPLKADGMNCSIEECEELIQNLDLEKCSCNKISNGKLSLKSSSWKSKSPENKKFHSNCENSSDSLSVPTESYSQCMAENHRNSFTNLEAVTRSTHFAMPESEDLELFLKAVNNSTDQLTLKDVSHAYSPPHVSEYKDMHYHQSKSGRRTGVKDKERKPASPRVNQWKSKLTPCINQQSCENTMSAHINYELTSLRTSYGGTLKQQMQLQDGRRNPQTFEASEIYENSKPRASDLALEDFHDEQGDFQREFTARGKNGKHSKSDLSVVQFYKPINLLKSSPCKITKCDIDTTTRPHDNSCTGYSDTEEQGEMNDSCDLFSTPEEVDSVFANTFKELSVRKTIPPKINFNNVQALLVNTQELLCSVDSNCYSDGTEYSNSVESHMIHHDESYDLFSTPEWRSSENAHENTAKFVSPGFQPDCNSFDLFSSSDEEL